MPPQITIRPPKITLAQTSFLTIFCHLNLTFLINYVAFAIKALILLYRGQSLSVLEIWLLVKLLLQTWLLLFQISLVIEIAVYMVWAYRLLLNRRHVEHDPLDYTPIAIRINRIMNGWLGRHMPLGQRLVVRLEDPWVENLEGQVVVY